MTCICQKQEGRYSKVITTPVQILFIYWFGYARLYAGCNYDINSLYIAFLCHGSLEIVTFFLVDHGNLTWENTANAGRPTNIAV